MKNLSIIVMKILKRIKSILKRIIWKILFQNSFKCGKGTVFYRGVNIVIERKGNVKIGNNCFFNRNCSINSMGKIKIGNDSIFGENVCIYDHNHNYKEFNQLTRKQGFNIKNVEIGDNCWIGSNVTILPGVIIGNNAVIGAGTTVCKSIPDNSIAINEKKLIIKEK